MQARVNITAFYTVNTSAKDLLDNEVGSVDPFLANSGMACSLSRHQSPAHGSGTAGGGGGAKPGAGNPCQSSVLLFPAGSIAHVSPAAVDTANATPPRGIGRWRTHGFLS